MNERGIGFWGLLAIFALVGSPVLLMIGDPVHFVWIIGTITILFGGLALRSSLRR